MRSLILLSAVLAILASQAGGQCRVQELAPGSSTVRRLSVGSDSLALADELTRQFLVYDWNGTAWELEESLPYPILDTFGPWDTWDIGLSESYLVVARQQNFSGYDVWIAERASGGFGAFEYVWVTNSGWTCNGNTLPAFAFDESVPRIFVGLPYLHSCSGEVSILEPIGGNWTNTGRFYPSGVPWAGTPNWRHVANDVDVDEEHIAFGARRTSDMVDMVFLNPLTQNGGTSSVSVSSSDPASVGFGSQLTLDAGILVVAAEQWSAAPLEVFQLSGGSWTSTGIIQPPAPYAGEAITDLDLRSERLVIGVESIGVIFEYRLSASETTLVRVRHLTGTGLGESVGRSALGTVAFGQGRVTAWPEDVLITEVCACDADAPCSNEAPFGGCRNLTGTGVWLTGCGSTSVTRGDFALNINRLPASTFATPFMGTLTTPTPLGNGQLCLGGGLARFATLQSVGTDTPVTGLAQFNQSQHPSSLQFAAGTTWSFQVWYRDNGGPCGETSNLSNAVTAMFRP